MICPNCSCLRRKFELGPFNSTPQDIVFVPGPVTTKRYIVPNVLRYLIILIFILIFGVQFPAVVCGGESPLQQPHQLTEEKNLYDPEVMSAPKNEDERTRRTIVELIKELKGEEEHVRRGAAANLGLIGPEAKEAVPALVQALRDSDASVRRLAVIALWSIGPLAKDAIPALIEAHKDGDKFVRSIVPFAVRHIRLSLSAADILSMSKGALPVTVVEALKDPDADIRRDAVFVLLRFAWLAEDALPALITALQDADVKVRGGAALTLSSWPAYTGPMAKDAIPVLIRVLEDMDEDIRQAVIEVFRNIRPPQPQEAIPALIKALNDVNESVRSGAVGALGNAEPTENVIRAISAALYDANIGVRQDAVFVLGKFARNGIVSAPKEAVPSLIAMLRDSKQGAEVRQDAVEVLAHIGPGAADAVPALIAALRDPESFIRRDVAWALGDMGAVATGAVPALMTALRDPEWSVRFAAAFALGEIGPDAKDAILELIAAFRDPDWPVHLAGAFALAKLGATARDAVPMLVATLKDPNREIGEVANRESGYAVSEGGIHTSDRIYDFEYMLDDLHSKVNQAQLYKESWLRHTQSYQAYMRKQLYGMRSKPSNWEEGLFDNPFGKAHRRSRPRRSRITPDEEWLKIAVRFPAAYALRSIGAPAVPALIPLLDDSEWFVRFVVVWALQGGGGSSLAALNNVAIKDSDYRIRYIATRALGSIGRPAVPVLLTMLEALDYYLRDPAIEALAQIGPEAKDAVPALVAMIPKTASETNPIPSWDIEKIAASLAKIAGGLQDSRDTSAIEVLEGALEALNRIPEQEIRGSEALLHADAIRRAVNFLKLSQWIQLKDKAVAFAQANPWVLLFPGYVLWVLVWSLIFWIHPYTVFRAADLLLPLDLHVPTALGRVQIAFQYLLFVGFLKHHPRVLDAWVARHIDAARTGFAQNDTVKNREIHIPLPVKLDEKDSQKLSCEHLRQYFNARLVRLLIWGEGGIGKTSLACEIARWVMDKDPTHRPCSEHLMVPILIDYELDASATAPFTNAVDMRLQEVVAPKTIPMDLIQSLLRHGRILVIVDHVSEMSEKTRLLIQRGIRDQQVATVIVTSRLKESLGSIAPTEIRPGSLEGSQLTSFMEAYLTFRSKQGLLSGRELHETCVRVWNLANPRKITAFLARQYIDSMIRVKDETGKLDGLPGNIPDLMLKYVDDLNEAVIEESRLERHLVRRVAGAVAWQCLRHSYRPAAARYRDALEGIKEVITNKEEEAPQYLKYMDARLRLLEMSKPAEDQVRFLLDPLVEYLAGRHLVETYAGAEEKWQQFLQEASKFSGDWQAISGFLLAVRGCCKAYGKDWDVPTRVISWIDERIEI